MIMKNHPGIVGPTALNDPLREEERDQAAEYVESIPSDHRTNS